jgi:hypothetical protein
LPRRLSGNKIDSASRAARPSEPDLVAHGGDFNPDLVAHTLPRPPSGNKIVSGRRRPAI